MDELTALDGLVAALRDLPEHAPASVAEVLAAAEISDLELDRVARFDRDHYARVRLHHDPRIEILVLGWEPGQATPIHDHAGQLGWVRVLRGVIEETAYRPVEPLGFTHTDLRGAERRPAHLHVDCCAQVPAGPAVARVDPVRAIHRLRNPGRERAITLHAYAKPHAVCLAFDMEAAIAWRREAGVDAVRGA